MPEYRRYRVEGATYFFTVVTDGREPFLCQEIVNIVMRRAIHWKAPLR